jgi:thioredoxin 1
MTELTREEVDKMPGRRVLEFGATWCTVCQALQPTVDELRQQYSRLPFHWVEDGKGKPLGRSFRVKLWPTFVFLDDGKILEQLVRPTGDELRDAFQKYAVTTLRSASVT